MVTANCKKKRLQPDYTEKKTVQGHKGIKHNEKITPKGGLKLGSKHFSEMDAILNFKT